MSDVSKKVIAFRRVSRLVVAGLALWTGAGVLSAQTIYTVWDLGSLPDTPDASSAWGVNAAGQVAGGSGVGDSGDRGFRWTPAVACPALPSLPLPAKSGLQPLAGYAACGAEGINAAGDAVGLSKFPMERATLWRADGTVVDLGGTMSAARGINSRGEIAGYKNAAYEDPVYWSAALVMETLPLLPSGYAGHPRGINDANVNGRAQMAGFSEDGPNHQRACLWSWTMAAWTVQGLPFLPGGIERSYGTDLNDAGKAVGEAYTAAYHRATLWDASGAHDLGDLPGGTQDSSAWGVNNLDQVVGSASASGGQHAFVWDDVRGMQDLNDMLDASGAGWTLGVAGDINDWGWIVGTGTNPDGKRHAFLLTPVPGPAGLSLLVVGGLALIRNRRT